MVAFGALEYTPVVSSPTFDNDGLAGIRQQAEEIYMLVYNEFMELGWLLASKGARRPLVLTFILLGPVIGSMGFKGRPKIAEGSLQDVCRAAVDHLDGKVVPVPTLDIYPE